MFLLKGLQRDYSVLIDNHRLLLDCNCVHHLLHLNNSIFVHYHRLLQCYLLMDDFLHPFDNWFFHVLCLYPNTFVHNGDLNYPINWVLHLNHTFSWFFYNPFNLSDFGSGVNWNFFDNLDLFRRQLNPLFYHNDLLNNLGNFHNPLNNPLNRHNFLNDHLHWVRPINNIRFLNLVVDVFFHSHNFLHNFFNHHCLQNFSDHLHWLLDIAVDNLQYLLPFSNLNDLLFDDVLNLNSWNFYNPLRTFNMDFLDNLLLSWDDLFNCPQLGDFPHTFYVVLLDSGHFNDPLNILWDDYENLFDNRDWELDLNWDIPHILDNLDSP